MARFFAFPDWHDHLTRLHERPAIILASWCGREAHRQRLQPHIGLFKVIIDQMLETDRVDPTYAKLATWIEKVCVDIVFRKDNPIWHAEYAGRWQGEAAQLEMLDCELIVLAIARRKTVFSEVKGLKEEDTIDGQIHDILGDIELAKRRLERIELMKSPNPVRRYINAKAD